MSTSKPAVAGTTGVVHGIVAAGRWSILSPGLSADLSKRRLATQHRRYRTIVTAGLAANPEPSSGRPRDAVERASYNLAVAFRDLQDDILRFASDLTVPFDNNGAERDLRMVKLHQKISGCFATMAGAERFAQSAATSPPPLNKATTSSPPSSTARPGSHHPT